MPSGVQRLWLCDLEIFGLKRIVAALNQAP
jgi:hypothetical protein